MTEFGDYWLGELDRVLRADRWPAPFGRIKTDWTRIGLHQTLGEMDIDAQLEHFHVGHYEEHADQLESLAP